MSDLRPPPGPRRDGWYRLTPGVVDGPVTVIGPGQDIVAWATNGQVVAFPAACPHRGAHLAAGTVEAGCLVCPMHGWRWRADGGNGGTGDGPPMAAAAAVVLPVHAGVDGALLWLSATAPGTPAHEAVDLAAMLPSGPDAVDVAWRFDIGGIDPAVIIGNAFDGAHIPYVHGRSRQVADLALAGDLARIDHVDAAGGRTRFTAYRSSQLAVDVATGRDDLALGVLFTVDAGPTTEATLRYRGVGPGAAVVVDRFARLHRGEVEADLAVFRRQRPEQGRYWGPDDDALRAYEAWVSALA